MTDDSKECLFRDKTSTTVAIVVLQKPLDRKIVEKQIGELKINVRHREIETQDTRQRTYRGHRTIETRFFSGNEDVGIINKKEFGTSRRSYDSCVNLIY